MGENNENSPRPNSNITGTFFTSHAGEKGTPASSCRSEEQMFQLHHGHRCEDLKLENNKV